MIEKEEAKDNVKRSKSREAALLFASKQGRVDTVRELIETGTVDINVKDTSGWTPLFHAFFGGYTDVVELLIEAGANVNAQDDKGDTSLHLATRSGRVDIVKAVIKAGGDLNVKDESGYTALFHACVMAYLTKDILKLLIEAGADVDVKDKHGRTPLAHASLYGYMRTAQLLIEAGAALDVKDGFGRTPLAYASVRGHTDTVELLIQAGAAVDMKDKNEDTSLHLASRSGHIAVVRSLIKAKTDINAKGMFERTPLYSAIVAGHVDVVKLLIEAGANVNVKESPDSGYTALHVATFKNLINVVKVLLEAGADVNAEDNSGKTALCRIAHRSNKYGESIGLLVNHVVRLEAASLYVSEKNLRNKDYINTSRNDYLHRSRICEEEIERLKSENIALYTFLKESNIDQLCNIWRNYESVSSKFNNQQNLRDRYPEYAYILINKANEVRKEIFLHNHRPLVDVLSMHYECDIEGMTFPCMKRFFNARRFDFKEKLGSGGLSLHSFVDFQDIEVRHIPKLKTKAFERVLNKWCTK